MQGIGGMLAILGAGSFVLSMLDREFSLLMWIDNWGAEVGTAIRIGMIVVGGGLWLAGRRREAAAE